MPGPDADSGPAFVELAARSGFSLLDGASNPEELAERAAELGMPALALADVFDLGGAVRFTRACDEAGVRPLLGASILLGPSVRPASLVLLCRDRGGWHALSALVTAARLSRPRGDPALPLGRLAGRTGGLAALLRSEGLDPDGEGTEGLLEELRSLFPDRLWLALENHGLSEDARACARWIARVEADGVPWIPVNAPLYARPSGRIVHDVLVCLRQGTTLDEAGDLLKPNGEWYLKGAAQMRARWCEAGDAGAPAPGPPPSRSCACRGCRALARTVEVADLCRFRLSDLAPRLPRFPVPGGGAPHAFLRGLVEEGARERWGEALSGRQRGQLDHELSVIRRLDLADYFLIMWDVVRFARRRGILVQGRGSAANSAVCYCLGITAVDPVGLDLLFERFLSESRHEPPDIDLDIAHRDREEVLQYVYRTYGRDHAAMVCESITWRGRMAVRDAARVLGWTQEVSDRLSAEVGRSDAEEAVRRLADGGLEAAGVDPCDPRARALARIVRGLEDLPRHRSIHVGGFVLSDRPIGELVPVERASMPDRTIIQWDKDDLDLPGFVKFDLLGLGMLTLLGDAIRLVRESRGVTVDLARLPPDDPAVYDMICEADTVGVFQIESRAQMNTLPRVRPRCFYDLVVEVALIRPGPIQGEMVHPYLRRRRGEEPVTYLDPRLEPLLARTLGVPLFQEQGMKVAIALAGFTPAQADNMRRAMGFKRSHRKMAEVERDLAEGLAANDVSPAAAAQVMKHLTAFANYGFPESHAASFALLVYASAWLKRYYAPEFTCALLNAQPMGFYAPSTIVHDARRHGVEVRPVDLARSEWDSTLEAEGVEGAPPLREASASVFPASDPRVQLPVPVAPPALRLGLRLVHGLGPKARERLRAAREGGRFTSVEDVVRRSGLRAPELRALAEGGAFETLWPGRREALWEVLRQARGDAGPLARRFPGPRRPLPPLSPLEATLADYRVTGVSPGGHPMRFLRAELERRGVLPAEALRGRRDGERVRVAGLAICRQRPGTAKGIMFVTLEDETGLANFVVMPNVGERLRRTLRAPLLLLEGTLENEQGVVNVLVRDAARLDFSGREIRSVSRDFR